MYKMIKLFYMLKRYKKDDVFAFFKAGYITAEDYKKITGDDAE